jgi:glyoxylate utilization-related uncharacterized protein
VSRLPSLPGAEYFKLVTPRLVPARFGESLIVGGETPVSAALPPGLERFLLGMEGEASVRLGESSIDLTGRGFIYLGPSQFATLELAAGASVIEIHDEEHGLYMTSGGGLYHLGGDQHPVRRDDFIYMAPYCPQGFRAGPDGGSYLLYTDVYRDGF